MGSRLRISKHAIDRVCERVDTSLTHEQARLLIEELVAKGKRRPRPRHWLGTPRVVHPRTAYVFAADYPGLCLVLNGDVVVTALTRETAIRDARRPAFVRQVS